MNLGGVPCNDLPYVPMNAADGMTVVLAKKPRCHTLCDQYNISTSSRRTGILGS